jgi:hypothetical protein
LYITSAAATSDAEKGDDKDESADKDDDYKLQSLDFNPTIIEYQLILIVRGRRRNSTATEHNNNANNFRRISVCVV